MRSPAVGADHIPPGGDLLHQRVEVWGGVFRVRIVKLGGVLELAELGPDLFDRLPVLDLYRWFGIVRSDSDVDRAGTVKVHQDEPGSLRGRDLIELC
ncbi:hypothetical protein W823_03095 [Williamsia sp. D3]|nr:hypothetical protein W823_03095 [Williamsia sp. D3]